jgi:hypothetical protein
MTGKVYVVAVKDYFADLPYVMLSYGYRTF